MIRLLIVDDHAAIREPLAMLLRAVKTGIDVREAGTVAEANSHLRDIDLAIVDLMLSDGSGTEIIERLKRQNRSARALVLTSNVKTVEAARAVVAGADGVLHKSSAFATVLESVNDLLAGKTLVSYDERLESTTVVAEFVLRDDRPQLTPRELDVLRAVATGLTDKEVATELHIGTETVRSHLVAVFHKFGVTNRMQALRAAIRFEFIDPYE